RMDLSPLDAAWLERIDARVRGDNERSFRAARRMVEIAPGSAWTISLANTALDTRRAALAREALLSIAPDKLGTERATYWLLLARADHLLGEHARELRTTEAGIRASGRSVLMLLAHVRALAALGRTGPMEEDLTELTARRPEGVPPPARLVGLAALELRGHGHPDEARRLLDRWLPRFDSPAAAGPRASAAALALLHLEHGDLAVADSLARAALADTTDPVTPRGLLGLVAAKRGDRAGARRWSAELAAVHHPYLFGHQTLWRARIAAALGDYPRAIALLRQASAEGADYHAWSMVHVVPEFEPMRRMHAFRLLVEPRD
ncbi:MAG TPA: hypothetical protein VFL93_13865, partial [Longimicrobiaceae bacterium]|nr:hypothetical protein [Longimicrobiaceae bacterium]